MRNSTDEDRRSKGLCRVRARKQRWRHVTELIRAKLQHFQCWALAQQPPSHVADGVAAEVQNSEAGRHQSLLASPCSQLLAGPRALLARLILAQSTLHEDRRKGA